MVSFYPYCMLSITPRVSVIIVLIIIFSEVLEHVGHEFTGEFLSCCESALTENGLLVLQVMFPSISFTFVLHLFVCTAFYNLWTFFSSFQCQTRRMTNTDLAQAS